LPKDARGRGTSAIAEPESGKYAENAGREMKKGNGCLAVAEIPEKRFSREKENDEKHP